jgi:dihydroflavonol-4-reductase
LINQKKIFITGATGLLGSYLCHELLSQGHKVKALYRNEASIQKLVNVFNTLNAGSGAVFNQAEWIKGDLTDMFLIEDAINDVDEVYHCAGLVSFDKKERDNLYKVNAAGTANIVNACLLKKDIKLCHVSSVAAINNAEYKTSLNEQVYWKTKGNESDYAKSKYSGEREVWRGIEEGLNAVIVNPGIVLASGFWEQSSGKIVSLAHKGISFYTEGVGAYIDVKDVVKAMLLLMEQQKFGERYILVEGNYTYKDVLDILHELFGNKKPGVKANKLLLQIAGWGSRIKHWFVPSADIITKEVITALLNKHQFDNSKIKSVQGFSFLPLIDSLKRVSEDFYRTNNK